MADSIEARLSRIERKLGIEDEQLTQAFAREIGDGIRLLNRRLDHLEARLNGGSKHETADNMAGGFGIAGQSIVAENSKSRY